MVIYLRNDFGPAVIRSSLWSKCESLVEEAMEVVVKEGGTSCSFWYFNDIYRLNDKRPPI
jgi:hypothetical protein